MKMLLNICLSENNQDIPFLPEAEKLLRSAYPDLYYFSLDNHSGTDMVSHALRLMEEAGQLLLVVQVRQEKAEAGRLLKLMNQMVRKRAQDHHMVMIGEHPVIKRMGKPLGERYHEAEQVSDLLPLADRIFS